MIEARHEHGEDTIVLYPSQAQALADRLQECIAEL